MVEYSNVHRAFMQTMSARGVLSTAQAIEILQNVHNAYGHEQSQKPPTRDALAAFVKHINQKLAVIDQKLEFVEMELDIPYKEFLVIVDGTTAPKFQGLYTEAECNFFKLVLNHMAESDGYQMTMTEILNLLPGGTANQKKVTKQRAQDLMEQWMAGGYFVELDDYVHYGPRTIGEFRDYFVVKHRDNIPRCGLCMQPTFAGVPCTNTACNTHLHPACAKKYFVKNKKCPTCKAVRAAETAD